MRFGEVAADDRAVWVASEREGKLLCRYRKTYLSEFPKYAGLKALSLEEDACAFSGAERCSYRLSVA